MTRWARLKAWWQELFPPASGGYWGEDRKVCTETLATHMADHHCRQQGAHYQHVCDEPECQFRWAR